MKHRRKILQMGLAGSAGVALQGLVTQPAMAYEKAAFDAKTWQEALKALGVGAFQESAEVQLTAPDIAENGAVVPVAVSCAAPGVKKIIVLVEKNPTPLSSVFQVSDDILANFSMRTKMGQTSNVYAIAVLADGRAWMAKKEIKVTLGGCGG